MHSNIVDILIVLQLAWLALAQATQHPYTSLFIPNDLWVTSFDASIAGADATATTYIFNCDADPKPATATNKCGPVTLAEGPGTAFFNQTDQLITRVWECDLFPKTGQLPTSASCLMSMTTVDYQFDGVQTVTWAPGTEYSAFQLRKFVVTAGSVPADFTDLATTTGAATATATADTATTRMTGTGAAATATTSGNASPGRQAQLSSSQRLGQWSLILTVASGGMLRLFGFP